MRRVFRVEKRKQLSLFSIQTRNTVTETMLEEHKKAIQSVLSDVMRAFIQSGSEAEKDLSHGK